MAIFIKCYIQHNNMKLNVEISKTRHQMKERLQVRSDVFL